MSTKEISEINKVALPAGVAWGVVVKVGNSGDFVPGNGLVVAGGGAVIVSVTPGKGEEVAFPVDTGLVGEVAVGGEAARVVFRAGDGELYPPRHNAMKMNGITHCLVFL